MSAAASASTDAPTKKEEPVVPALPPVTVPVPEALEEDDDFEEFKEEDWGDERKNKAAAEEWANDWDDEDADSDFDKILRTELEKAQQQQQQSSSSVAAAGAGGGK